MDTAAQDERRERGLDPGRPHGGRDLSDVEIGQANLERFPGASREPGRVALLSPYSDNLGDAAILSSIIQNAYARLRQVEFFAFTLNPEVMRRQHGIDGTYLTETPRENYFWGCPRSNGESRNEKAKPRVPLRETLKRVTVLRVTVRWMRIVRLELVHTAKVAKALRTCDLVLIAGGGALDEFWGGPWGHPWTLFKFAVLCRLFRISLGFISVGKCAVEKPLSRLFIRYALRVAGIRTYRDDTSLAAASGLFRQPEDRVCPDLAYGYCLPAQSAGSRFRDRSEKPVVALSPIACYDPRVWPVKDGSRYKRYVAELAKAVDCLLDQGCRIVLFTTDSPDCRAADDLLAASQYSTANRGLIRVLPGPPAQTIDGLMRELCAVDLVIASRLHGVLLSHLVELPVLAIAYDPKVDVHMKAIGQEAYCLKFDHFSARELIDRFNVLAGVRLQEAANVKREVHQYCQQVQTQYDLLFGPRRAGVELEEDRDQLSY